MSPEVRSHFQKVATASDERWAENIGLFFLQDGRADADRQNTTISAILRVGNQQNNNLAGGDARSWKTRISANKARLHITKSLYSGPQIKKGDRIRALDRAGQPWFEVLDVNAKGQVRAVIELGAI